MTNPNFVFIWLAWVILAEVVFYLFMRKEREHQFGLKSAAQIIEAVPLYFAGFFAAVHAPNIILGIFGLLLIVVDLKLNGVVVKFSIRKSFFSMLFKVLLVLAWFIFIAPRF